MSKCILTDVHIYVDGKQVSCFFQRPIRIIEVGSQQSLKLLKRYDDFTGKLTITIRQGCRLVFYMAYELLRFRMVQGLLSFKVKWQKIRQKNI